MKNKKWRAEFGKEYWYYEKLAGSMCISNAYDYRKPEDDNKYNTGNYYQWDNLAVEDYNKLYNKLK